MNRQILTLARSGAWCARPGSVKALCHTVPEASAIDITFEDFFECRAPLVIHPNGVAEISVQGMLVHSLPAIYEKLGFVTRYGTIIAEISAAVAAGAKSILLRVNSPGGHCSGLPEASAAIMSAPVPVTAHCDGMACSAAYWLACSAGNVIASESAEIGNVGCIMAWGDDSEFWKMLGVEWKALVNEGADLKSTFHLEPDAAQTEFLQQSVDAIGNAFREHVTARRDNIDPEVFRAGWYSGDRAWALGLCDGVGTYADVLAMAAPAADLTNPETMGQ